MNLMHKKENSVKYINVEKLKEKIKKFSEIEYNGNTLGDDVANSALDYVLEEIIPSIQQEQSAFVTDNSLGSPDYERGFSHGRDFQLECDLKKTDQEKVKAFLINKGYPINTNGDIPTYDETFNLVKKLLSTLNINSS